MAIPLLDIRNLAISYPSPSASVHAVRNINVRIFPGEIFALVGESGCGKSSVALSILGLLDGFAAIESGEILFQGIDLLRVRGNRWRSIRGSLIGMIFQDPRGALNPVLTIGRHLVEALQAHRKLSARQAAAEAIRLLSEVGIPEPERALHRYPQEFSGGMCQRVCIALAACHRPRLLIADEPTSALDPGLKAQVLQLLFESSRNLDMAVLLISHDLALIAGFAQTVAVMYHGRIVEIGPAADLLSNPAHPYTQGLCRSQPGATHHPTRNPLRPIPGLPPPAGREMPGCAFAPRCGLADARCSRELPLLEPVSEQRLAACLKTIPVGGA